MNVNYNLANDDAAKDIHLDSGFVIKYGSFNRAGDKAWHLPGNLIERDRVSAIRKMEGYVKNMGNCRYEKW